MENASEWIQMAWSLGDVARADNHDRSRAPRRLGDGLFQGLFNAFHPNSSMWSLGELPMEPMRGHDISKRCKRGLPCARSRSMMAMAFQND